MERRTAMKTKSCPVSFALFLLLLLPASAWSKPVQVEFPAPDGVTVTADLYMAHPKESAFIILFHRAGWSRGEYLSIAPKLLKLGFNCMAVDLRAGGQINGAVNQTRLSAVKAGRATTFLDAEKDMMAAIVFVRKNYAKGSLILWGSSYSASLVIKIAAEHGGICDAALVFSPGEYFQKFGKSSSFIRVRAGKIKVPIFFTSASTEKTRWWSIYSAVPTGFRTYFIPDEDGAHGSEALWESTWSSEEYWDAVEDFLAPFLQKDS